MTDEMPVIVPGSARNELIYKILLITAAVAAVFCLVVLGLLVNNAVQARWYDPLTSTQMTALKDELAKDPFNEQLTQSVRDMDQYLRYRYFSTRYIAIVGLYILLGGAAVLLLTLHFIGTMRARLPMPAILSGPKDAVLHTAITRRAYLLAGIVLLAGMLTLAVLSRHDAAAAYAQSADTSNVDVIAQTLGNQPPLSSSEPPGVTTPGLPGMEAPPAMPGMPGLPSMPSMPGMSEPGPMGPPGASGSMGPAGPPGPPGPPAPPSKTANGGKPAPPGKTGLQPDKGALTKVEGGATPEEMAKNWAAFRGPGGGVAKGEKYLSSWDAGAGKGILWKTAMPLPAPNSPIYWNGRLFMSGATREKREVYGVDAVSGKILWKQSVKAATGDELPEVMESTGYAAPTMACDGKHVFAIFADGNVVAFDLDGKPTWSKSLGKPLNNYGHASSLAVYKNLLLIQFDQGAADEKLSSLLALNTADGKVAYRVDRPVPACWASPLVVNTGQRDEVILCGNPFVISYDPATGNELWRTEALSGEIAPSPCYANGVVYVTQEGAGLTAIKVPTSADGKAGQVMWKADDGAPDTVSPATNGEIVVVVNSSGTVTCYGTKDGAKLWERDMGAPCSASPVFVGESVYLTDDKGVTHVFEAGTKFKALGSGKLGEAVAATPAFVDGKIYLRGAKTLFAIGNK